MSPSKSLTHTWCPPRYTCVSVLFCHVLSVLCLSHSWLLLFLDCYWCNCKWHCSFNFCLQKCVISTRKCKKLGHLGGSIGEASAFSSGHDPRVLGSPPVLGSPLIEGLFLPLSDTPPARAFFHPVKEIKSEKNSNNRSLYIDFISCTFTEFFYSNSFFVESWGISCHLQTVTVFLYGFHIFLFSRKLCWPPYSTSLDFDVVFRDSLFAYTA